MCQPDTMSQHSSVPREEKMNKKTSGTTRAIQGEDFSQRDQLHSTTTLFSCSTFSSTNKLLDQPSNARQCTVEGRYPGLARRGFNWQPSCYLPHAPKSSTKKDLQFCQHLQRQILQRTIRRINQTGMNTGVRLRKNSNSEQKAMSDNIGRLPLI